MLKETNHRKPSDPWCGKRSEDSHCVGAAVTSEFLPISLFFLSHGPSHFHKYLLSASTPVTVGTEMKEIQWFPQGCLKKKNVKNNLNCEHFFVYKLYIKKVDT